MHHVRVFRTSPSSSLKSFIELERVQDFVGGILTKTVELAPTVR